MSPDEPPLVGPPPGDDVEVGVGPVVGVAVGVEVPVADEDGDDVDAQVDSAEARLEVTAALS